MTPRTLILAALAALHVAGSAASRDVTFVSTSDSHYAYVKNEDRNYRDLATLKAINGVTGLQWPAEAGAGPIGRPRGVMLLGDVIDDGDLLLDGVNVSEKQYEAFASQCGLTGTEAALKFPVFETWGNHDGPPAGKAKNGFSFQEQLQKRNQERLKKGLINSVSPAGVHASWDWDDVHFVLLGIYPADKQRDGVRYSPVWHDPQGALTFLREDLARKVGTSGRPVVLMSHCGFDTDWWTPEDWKAVYDVAAAYNVVLYLYGHSGTGVREWAPDGEARKWLCINDGQLENGFFVIQVRDGDLRYGYRVKQWTEREIPDGKTNRVWNGGWKWAWTGTAPISEGPK
jgi:cytolysin (calcineurin-like family phosphatase)